MINPKIFIADDHPILIKGLKDLLLEKKYNFVGSATDGQTALNFILKEQPNIAILDIEMPNLTGIEIAMECKKNGLETKIILITLHKEIDLYLRAKKYNIFGYLLKEFALDEIESCIISVANGKAYFSKSIKKEIGFDSESDDILNSLTPTEKRVIKLIAKHKTNKEIGHLLFISPRTVENHRSNIISKLNLNQRTSSLLIWVQKNRHLFN